MVKCCGGLSPFLQRPSEDVHGIRPDEHDEPVLAAAEVLLPLARLREAGDRLARLADRPVDVWRDDVHEDVVRPPPPLPLLAEGGPHRDPSASGGKWGEGVGIGAGRGRGVVVHTYVHVRMFMS